ncbi:MAG: phosphatase PAP2 family protein [Candidatus Binatia bacterium]
MTRPVLIFGVWLILMAFPRAISAQAGGDVPSDSPDKSAADEVVDKTKEAAGKTAEVAKEAAEKTADVAKEAVLSFRDDIFGLPSRVWQDVQGLPHWKNFAALSLGGALAAYSHEEWDDRVRADVRRHPDRFGRGTNDAVDIIGSTYTFYGLSGAAYGLSLFVDDQRLHDFALDQISALTMEMPVVFALKRGFHTKRPNGDRDGFPSGHAAVAASFGALLNRHYGTIPGLLGSGLAAFVALHRIDARHHDLSDVIFGAAIGYIAGRTAGDVEEFQVLKAQLLPLEGPTGERGLRLEWRF